MRRARAVGGARAPKLRESPSIVPVRLPPPRWTCQALRTANFCPLKMNTSIDVLKSRPQRDRLRRYVCTQQWRIGSRGSEAAFQGPALAERACGRDSPPRPSWSRAWCRGTEIAYLTALRIFQEGAHGGGKLAEVLLPTHRSSSAHLQQPATGPIVSPLAHRIVSPPARQEQLVRPTTSRQHPRTGTQCHHRLSLAQAPPLLTAQNRAVVCRARAARAAFRLETPTALWGKLSEDRTPNGLCILVGIAHATARSLPPSPLAKTG